MAKVAICACVLLWVDVASAQELDAALHLYERGDPASEQAFSDLLRSGALAPDDVASVLAHLAVLRLALGDSGAEPEAELLFRRTLAITQELVVVRDIAPHQREVVTRARQAQPEPARLRVESPRPGQLRASMRGAPEGWVATIEAASGSWHSTFEDGVLEVPPSSFDEASIDIRVTARDEHGNALFVGSTQVQRPLAAPSPSETAAQAQGSAGALTPDDEPSERRRGLAIGLGIGGALLVVAAAIGLGVGLARGRADEFQQWDVQWQRSR